MKILTFDIEDWFHLLNNPYTENPVNWDSFESRIERNMQTIFDLLDSTDTSATFFCLGWIAERYPHIIREISNRGFEVASHTYSHQLVFKQSPDVFKEDVYRSVCVLEDLTGKKVISFRAPSFSLTQNSTWLLDILLELGIQNDASLFPSRRSNGGMSNFDISNPFRINLKDGLLKEFPVSKASVMKQKVVYSGGGYFRLCPYSLVKSLSNQKYIMSYFHPRDFDYGQPVLDGLSTANRFKSYVGLRTCQGKLHRWLSEFDFIDLREADNLIDWNKTMQYEFK